MVLISEVLMSLLNLGLQTHLTTGPLCSLTLLVSHRTHLGTQGQPAFSLSDPAQGKPVGTKAGACITLCS
jgi:hypothetical protein